MSGGIPDLLLVAVQFYRDPHRYPQFSDPHLALPPGVSDLLAVYGGCMAEDQIAATARRLSATEQELHEALVFWVKQALFRSGGDAYRTLGLAPDADTALIKQHYRHLISLFHPDRDVANEGWDQLYAPQINDAYGQIRNKEKRKRYDEQLLSPAHESSVQRTTATQGEGLGRRPSDDHLGRANAPRPRARAPVAGGLFRSPWLWGGVVGGLLVLTTMLSMKATREPTLVMVASNTQPNATESAALKPWERVEQRNRAQRDAAAEPMQAQSASDVKADAPQPVSVARAPVPDPSAADRRIEERIKAEVNRARRSVLGSRPAPQAKPKRPTPVPAESSPSVVAVAKAPIEGTRAVASSEPASVTVNPETEQLVLAAQPQQVAPGADKGGRGEVATVERVLDDHASQAKKAEPAPVPLTVAEPEPEAAAAVTLSQPDAVLVAPANAMARTETMSSSADEMSDEPTTRRVSLSASVPPDEVQLAALVRAFAERYKARDAGGFANLFAERARTPDGNTRARIEQTYAEFFDTVEVIDFSYDSVAWKPKNPRQRLYSTVVKARITTAPREGGAAETVEAVIEFESRPSGDGMVFTRMDY